MLYQQWYEGCCLLQGAELWPHLTHPPCPGSVRYGGSSGDDTYSEKLAGKPARSQNKDWQTEFIGAYTSVLQLGLLATTRNPGFLVSFDCPRLLLYWCHSPSRYQGQGWRGCITGYVLEHMAPCTPSGVVSEYKTGSEALASPGVVQKQKCKWLCCQSFKR